MTHFRISKAAELLGVSDDTVRRWIASGQLSESKDESGRSVIDGEQLAVFAQAQAHQPETDSAVSARNELPGLVTRVISDKVMSQVEMQCGNFRITSLISTEAVEELGLAPGVLATAQIKATNVVINRSDK